MDSSNSPMVDRQTHRALVAFPVFAVVVLVSLLVAILQHGKAGASVSHQSSMSVIVEGGVLEDDVLFLEGDRTYVASYALSQFLVKSVGVSMFGGTVSIAESSDSLTVAAITSPVLLHVADSRMMLPVGYQWRGQRAQSGSIKLSVRDIALLPAGYLRTAYKDAQRLESGLSSSVRTASALTSLPYAGWLQLPASRMRAELTDIYSRLQEWVEEGTEVSDQLLSDIEALPLSEQSELLFEVERLDALSLLPLLLRDDTVRSLVRFHPVLRDRAWSVTTADTEVEDSPLFTLLQLPSSDIAPDPIASETIAKWRQALSAHMTHADDGAALADAVVRVLLPSFHSLNNRNFALRSRSYTEALLTAVEPWNLIMDKDQVAELQSLMEEPLRFAVVQREESVSAVHTESQEPIVPTDADVASFKSQLSGLGYMFTSNTKVVAHQNGRILVEDVVLGSSAGDIITSFSYDLATNRAWGFDEKGREYRYPLDLEAFTAWLRR